MNPKVMLFLFFGVGIVGVVMFLHFNKPTALPLHNHLLDVKKENIRVFVAKRNLQVGHWVNVKDDLTEKTFLSGKQPRGAVPVTQSVKGEVIRSPVTAGEVIVRDDLVSQDDPDFLSYALPSGEGAFSFEITRKNIVDAFVQPGERVDILAFANGSGGGSLRATQIALRNVRVLAVNHHLETMRKTNQLYVHMQQKVASKVSQQAQTAMPSQAQAETVNMISNMPYLVTVEVTRDQSVTLMQALNTGVLSFVLRSAQNNNDVEQSSSIGTTMVYNGPFNSQLE